MASPTAFTAAFKQIAKLYSEDREQIRTLGLEVAKADLKAKADNASAKQKFSFDTKLQTQKDTAALERTKVQKQVDFTKGNLDNGIVEYNTALEQALQSSGGQRPTAINIPDPRRVTPTALNKLFPDYPRGGAVPIDIAEERIRSKYGSDTLAKAGARMKAIQQVHPSFFGQEDDAARTPDGSNRQNGTGPFGPIKRPDALQDTGPQTNDRAELLERAKKRYIKRGLPVPPDDEIFALLDKARQSP